MIRTLGFASIVICVAAAAGCLFDEDTAPIDYLRIDGAIIVQALDIDPSLPEIEQRLTPPWLTLYGDGTLIRAEPDGNGGHRITRARVPEADVRELVEDLADEGFLDFYVFEEPGWDGPEDATVTYLYLNTKQGTNSVRALGLDRPPGEGASDEHERLAEIYQRLRVTTGADARPYTSDRVALFVQVADPADVGDDYYAWRIPEIDLAEVAGETGAGSAILSATQTKLLAPGAGWRPFVQDETVFLVGFRPALPFEERFPEFDFPAPP